MTLLSLLTLLSTTTAYSSVEELVRGPYEYVDGLAINEYTNKWWQWASSMPNSASAVADQTGEKCHHNQQGPVWFLAGGYGSSKILRECTITSDKHIFFPIINTMTWRAQGKKGAKFTCKQAIESTNVINSSLDYIEVSINGQVLTNPEFLRQKSPECFDLYGAIPEQYRPPQGYPAATDGYWLMVNPLSPGVHSLKFKARYTKSPTEKNGVMIQDIEYKLNII